MSQAGNLTKEKVERLKTFLKNESIEKCCEQFGVGVPSMREGLCNTVKSLHGFYVRGAEYYLGNFSSTRDITANKDIVNVWLERFRRRDKPNAFESETVIANDEEIIRGIIDTFPSKNQQYDENAKRIEGALWVLRNFKVTGKIKN
jgi:hypothetical protein